MTDETSPPADLPTEVTRSLTALWKRYAIERPAEAETEISGSVVRCVLHGAVENFEKGMAAQADDDRDGKSARDVTTYRRDAAAAVSKATHKRVLAFISDHDAKTDVATEVFVLDGSLRNAPMGSEGAIAR